MREAPALMPRREMWRSLEGNYLRDVTADALDQNDRDHVALATEIRGLSKEVRKVGALLTTNLAALALSAMLLAANLAFRIV